MSEIRTFPSGATRDTEKGKLSYIRALDPLVMERYVEYIGEHRVRSDGGLRDWDNWKRGIPREVYLDSAFRHLMNVWMIHENINVENPHDGHVDIENALCGLIFNATGYLYEILYKEKK